MLLVMVLRIPPSHALRMSGDKVVSMPFRDGQHSGKLRLDNHKAFVFNALVDDLLALLFLVPFHARVAHLVDETFAR